MLNADEEDASAYSASPAALMYRSRQIWEHCWSVWKTCESVVAEENYQNGISK